jgi:hypothetical protein
MSTRSQTYIARRRPVELAARRSTTEEMVETWEGPRTAYPGDYVITGVKGEQWPVLAAEFEKLYDVASPPDEEGNLRVRKKIFDVATYQTYQPITFTVQDEEFHADTGYFIISYGEDARYPCEPGVFFETFEILRQADEDEAFDVTEESQA